MQQHSELFKDALSTMMDYKPELMDAITVKPRKDVLRITIEVPAEDINWDACSCERDSIATDRGDEPTHTVDVSSATFWGHLVEFSDEDKAMDHMIEDSQR